MDFSLHSVESETECARCTEHLIESASGIHAQKKWSISPTLPKREASSCELQLLVNKFIPEVIGKEIEKACQTTYPLQNVHIRKVKMLKKPKFDLTKLLEIHGDNGAAPVSTGEDKGETVKVADLGEGQEQKEVIGA